jgi:hypothetical protein
MTGGTVARVRSAFVSYGSCSTAEPVQELTRLGLIRRNSVVG